MSYDFCVCPITGLMASDFLSADELKEIHERPETSDEDFANYLSIMQCNGEVQLNG